MGTTNYGFTTLQSTDHTRIWELVNEPLDDIDAFIKAFLLQDASSWTPAWTSSGTAPAIGTGTRTGRYVQVGKRVVCQATLVFGGTTTFGTGTYGFSLPVTAASDTKAVGGAYLRDESAAASGHFPAICVINPVVSTTVCNLFNVNAQVGATFPFTFANTDSISFSIGYLAA